MAAIVEESNERHPGFVYLRSTGDRGEDIINSNLFIDYHKAASFLTGSKDENERPNKFMDKITSGAETLAEWNELADLINKFRTLIAGRTLLDNRTNKKGIWLPDRKYFEKKYENAIDDSLTDAQKSQRNRALFLEFRETIRNAIIRNEKGTVLESLNNNLNNQKRNLR